MRGKKKKILQPKDNPNFFFFFSFLISLFLHPFLYSPILFYRRTHLSVDQQNTIVRMDQHSNGSPNGKLEATSSLTPDIPHVTANILPLSNILKFYTQEAYKQLTTAVENLSMNVEDESDIKRKKYFLDIIISLRQDFIKVYTLIKWASISKDVSKFIDLLNWFRLQEFQFENLMFQLNGLTGYSGAKLPNSDILTALEVLYKGRPTLPSYNHIKIKNLSLEKILEVLEDLNLVLMTRFALMDVPKKFQYEIKDGRVYITVSNEFEVSITVGNDMIIDKKEDYYKSPFYFIDFKFLFGINPETSMITYHDDKVFTRLPASLHGKLEKIANQVLLKEGLEGLYDLLHRYSTSFKIYLIAKQFKELLNTRWRNNVQINYQTGKSLIIVNYWSLHYLSKNWKSFLELGIDRNSNLSYRWFKNGQYCVDEELNKIFHIIPQDNLNDTGNASNNSNSNNNNSNTNEDGVDEESYSDDLNVDLILNVVVNKHAELLMGMIYEQLLDKFGEDEVSMVTPHQLLLQISPNKSTVFAINPLTGFFYFIDPTPIQNQITKKINLPPPIVKPLITEIDMVGHIIDQIIQLRVEVFNKEINNKLATTEWINNGIIKLGEYEMSKMTNFLMENDEVVIGVSKVQFYRRKNWPSSWFLINMVSGLNTRSYWWVARIKSINGDWKIQWVQIIKFKEDQKGEENVNLVGVNLEELNYKFFSELSTFSSNMIIDHMVLEELNLRKVRFLKIKKSEKEVLDRFNLKLPDETGTNSLQTNVDSSLGGVHYESMLLIHNDDLLPIYNSSSSLFLKVQLVGKNEMYLKLFGNLRNLKIKSSKEYELKLNLKIDEVNNFFQVDNTVDLLSVINESKQNLLDLIFNTLNKLNELIKILDQLSRNKITILDNSMDNITIKVSDDINNLVIKLPEQADHSIQLVAKEETSWEIQLILKYLNQYLHEHKSSNILGIIKYLHEINPIINSKNVIAEQIEKMSKSTMKLANGLSKLNFDLVFFNLNHLQFIYFINSTISNMKKIQKDKILINISFKNLKFDQKKRELIKISLKDNLNPKNMKFKKLFEIMFKNINELIVNKNSTNKKNPTINVHPITTTTSIEDDLINFDANDSEDDDNEKEKEKPNDASDKEEEQQQLVFIKLNYDYLITKDNFGPIMNEITKSFIQYLQE